MGEVGTAMGTDQVNGRVCSRNEITRAAVQNLGEEVQLKGESSGIYLTLGDVCLGIEPDQLAL